MNLDPTSEDTGAAHEGGGRPPRCAPLPREHPGGPRTYPLHPYIPTYPKTSKTEDQTESKRNETFGNVIFGTNVIQRTWTL